MNARFPGYGHKVRVPEPARQHVQMHMAGDARASSAAQIHSQIHPIRLVIGAKGSLNALRQPNHFAQRLRITRSEVRNVRVRNDHHVPGSIRITIKNDERLSAPIDQQCLGIVFPRHSIAENAVWLDATRRFLHVLVPPRGPEMIHQPAVPRRLSIFVGVRRSCRRFHAVSTKATSPAIDSDSSKRSEEHTSELQSPDHLVCRLLLEKKKKRTVSSNP